MFFLLKIQREEKLKYKKRSMLIGSTCFFYTTKNEISFFTKLQKPLL